MSTHSSDLFSIGSAQNAESGEWDFILRRLDPHDNLITRDTFSMTRQEATVFFDFLLTMPEYQERVSKHIIPNPLP